MERSFHRFKFVDSGLRLILFLSLLTMMWIHKLIKSYQVVSCVSTDNATLSKVFYECFLFACYMMLRKCLDNATSNLVFANF